MFKKLHLTVFISVIIIINLKSQSDFKQGYIITNRQDTIFGLINNRGYSQNAQSCIFKNDINSKITEYFPNDILGYRFLDGKYYVSKGIKEDTIVKYAFLEYLIHGIVDVYYYRDINNECFYIQKQGDSLYALKSVERKYNGSNWYTFTNKKYIGVIKALFYDAPSMQNKINNVLLNRNDLIGIAKEYHNQVCSDKACIIYVKNDTTKKIKFGILLSSLSQISSKKSFSIRREYLTNTGSFEKITLIDLKFNTPSNFSAGLFLNLSLSSINERLSLQYEGVFSKQHYSVYYKTINNSYSFDYKYVVTDTTEIMASSFSQTALFHTIFLKYCIPNKKLAPIIQAGIFVNQTLKTKYNDVNLNLTLLDPNIMGFSGGMGYVYRFNKNQEIFLQIVYDLGLNFGYNSIKFFNTSDIRFTVGFSIL